MSEKATMLVGLFEKDKGPAKARKKTILRPLIGSMVAYVNDLYIRGDQAAGVGAFTG